MLFIFILLLIITSNVIGCIFIRKKPIKTFLGTMAIIWALLAVLVGGFIFETTYKINEVDVSQSSNGEYVLYFQQVGDPSTWPFGDTHVRLVLKNGGKTLIKYNFDINNDGANVSAWNWQVSWEENFVSAFIYGEEKRGMQYDLYFDGTIEENQLKTYYVEMNDESQTDDQSQNNLDCINAEDQAESSIDEVENVMDEKGYPLDEEYQAYKQELCTISEVIDKTTDYEMEYKLTSNGYPYSIISKDTNSDTGEYTEFQLVFNEQYQHTSVHEYVLEKYHYSADGLEVQSPEVVDFYLIDCNTLEVTDEHTSTWH